MDGQVSDEVKKNRMSRLLELQKAIMGKLAKRYEGTVQEVLVEEEREEGTLIGRTTTNKWATFKGERD